MIRGLSYRCKLLAVVVFLLVPKLLVAQIEYIEEAVSNEIAEERQRIHEMFDYLEQNNKFTDYLDLGETVELPIGLKKTIGNMVYVIAIDSIVITPTYAYLNATMSFRPSQSTDDKRIAFRGTNIKFTKNGGLSGEARLELVGDYLIGKDGNDMQLYLKGDETFVLWDCDGFREFSLGGSLVFSRDVLVPINEEKEAMVGNVHADFNVKVGDWNDLIANATITPFQSPKLKDFSFFVDELYIDFSDLQNPSNAKFNPEYNANYMIPGQPELWRGVYLSGFKVYLPPQFEKEDGQLPMIEGRDIWVDEFGLSGEFTGSYLVSLDSGQSSSMSGWPFSIDAFELAMTAGRINHSSLAGQIVLSVSDESTPLDYKAFLDQENNYLFNVTPAENINFNIWKADVTLYESSYVNVEVKNGKFIPSALLNGRMNIKAPVNSQDSVELADLEFEQLRLTSSAPYIAGGVFSPEGQLPQIAGFGVDLKKIGLVTIDNNTVAMAVDGAIMLNGEAGGSFAGEGGFKILAKKSEGPRTKWKFDRIEVESIALDVSNAACSMQGKLEFYDEHKTFGKGFYGSVQASFKPGIFVNAKARFGKVKNYKYWYADALASFGKSVTIAPGLGISAFGGGASYHMNRIPAKEESGGSGFDYVPDPIIGLNIRAAVKLVSDPEPNSFNGDAAFEISFYNSGGLRNLNFKGDAYFMSLPIEGELANIRSKSKLMAKYTSNQNQPEGELGSKEAIQNASMTGHINVNYDFMNRILHGNLEVYVNAANGMLTGAGANGRAGWAVMHFAPSEWYVHIGAPENRLGLNLGLGKLSASATGYFMTGTNIPSSPPPDENVGRILGGIDLGYMRDENALGTGRGFAMGAALHFDTGDLTFMKFYARFMAGAGFDIMLKNYGADAFCVNRSGPIGMNGWYANGQAYGYFDGKIGLKVDVFGDVQRVDILNLSAAAVLQAKLPNPFWMRGIVGGSFSALNGLISGECKFQVTVGEECDMSDLSAVSGLEVIAELTPNSGDSDISVFNNPQAIFNLAIDKEFALVNQYDKEEKYRIKLDHFRARTAGRIVDGTFEWNERHDVAMLRPFEILPPETEITLEVQISYEKNEGGNWIPVTKKGNVVVEKKSALFVTGNAPDYIPDSNIAFAYPTPDMENYYPEEADNGYIQLVKGQAYLFEQEEGWDKVIRLASSNQENELEVSYNSSKMRVEFQLPKMSVASPAELVILNKPLDKSTDVDANVVTVIHDVEPGSDIKVKTQQGEGTVESNQETIIYANRFDISRYRTFKEKVESVTIKSVARDEVAKYDSHRLVVWTIMDEKFKDEELNGSEWSDGPLIQIEADISQSVYFNSTVKPLVYANYPIDGVVKIKNRDVNILGLFPVKAIRFDSDLNLLYELPMIYLKDFNDIRNQVVPLYLYKENVPLQINDLLFNPYPILSYGDYMIRLSYYLPGTSEPNSTYQMKVGWH